MISTKRRRAPRCYRLRGRRACAGSPRSGGSMLIPSSTRISALAAALSALLLPLGATRADEPNSQVRVSTSMGEFVIEVRADRAPLTATNFLHYVREGFYSNTVFHRVIANF